VAARNTYRTKLNIHEKEMFVKLVIYKDYTEMHGPQNTKNWEHYIDGGIMDLKAQNL
jgi:hypothetical protein